MANNVKIKRGGIVKEIPKDQWKSMRKQTYGWTLHHEISSEVLEIEKSIEAVSSDVVVEKEVKPKQKRNGKNFDSSTTREMGENVTKKRNES